MVDLLREDLAETAIELSEELPVGGRTRVPFRIDDLLELLEPSSLPFEDLPRPPAQ